MNIISEGHFIGGEWLTDENGEYIIEAIIPDYAYTSAQTGGYPCSLAVSALVYIMD